MSLPNTILNVENIRKIEDEILLICRHCKTLEELQSAGDSIWQWSAAALKTSIEDLRSQIESHVMDEKFPDAFSEEKDHFLKLPIVLLEHYHHPQI